MHAKFLNLLKDVDGDHSAALDIWELDNTGAEIILGTLRIAGELIPIFDGLLLFRCADGASGIVARKMIALGRCRWRVLLEALRPELPMLVAAIDGDLGATFGQILTSWIPPQHLQNVIACERLLSENIQQKIRVLGPSSLDVDEKVVLAAALASCGVKHLEEVPADFEYLYWRTIANSYSAMLPLLGGLAPGPILDLGCGVGQLSGLLAALYPQAALVMQDSCLMNLVVAKRSFLHQREFLGVVADATLHIPLVYAACASVVCNDALSWFGDLSSVISELVRVSGPNGQVIIGALYNSVHSNCPRYTGDFRTKDGWVQLLEKLRAVSSDIFDGEELLANCDGRSPHAANRDASYTFVRYPSEVQPAWERVITDVGHFISPAYRLSSYQNCVLRVERIEVSSVCHPTRVADMPEKLSIDTTRSSEVREALRRGILEVRLSGLGSSLWDGQEITIHAF